MISNLLVLTFFSALVSLGVCIPSNFSNISNLLYEKCPSQLEHFKKYTACKEEVTPIQFHGDVVNYVCLLSYNLILEACKQDLLPKIKEDVDVKFSDQTCPINYVAKYNYLKTDLSSGIMYMRNRTLCESVCLMDKDSLKTCNFLNELIKLFNEESEREHDKSSKVKTPDEIDLVKGDKTLENEFNNDLQQKNTPSVGVADSTIHYKSNKTDVSMKANSTKVKLEKSNSPKEIQVDDNMKGTTVVIKGNKSSNKEKNPGQKLSDDSVVENQTNYSFPGKNDKQDTMPISNPVDASTYSMQTQPGSYGVLASKNLNNNEKDYRIDVDGGGGGDDDDDDGDPAALAAADSVSHDANPNNKYINNNNNNNNNNNINDDEMEKSVMEDALPDREPPQLAKSINSKEIYSSDNFFQAEDSHFSTYFLMTISLIIIGYIVYHNKNKIVAYALEGRRTRNGRRRAASSASYRKLDCNLEEAIASNPSHASVTNVVY